MDSHIVNLDYMNQMKPSRTELVSSDKQTAAIDWCCPSRAGEATSEEALVNTRRLGTKTHVIFRCVEIARIFPHLARDHP
jgi:hypothetical protein